MIADIHILHESDLYRVVDYKCHCDICSLSDKEYNESFCLSFIRKGYFEYRTFKQNHDAHVGRILLSKPDYEHLTKHIDNQPDSTTVFEFKPSFFKEISDHYKKIAGWFLGNNDLHSLLLSSTPELEHLHTTILRKISKQAGYNLETDELVMDLLGKVLGILGNTREPEPVPATIIRHHLVTGEAAREYILDHFNENISLHQVATHCHVSPFHFSRIFKTIFRVSPHQYLAAFRLNHAKMLLETTHQPVSDIAFQCGYNSLEHFATAFRQRFRKSPSGFRVEPLKKQDF